MLNGFQQQADGPALPQLRLMSTMFQGIFPPISVEKVSLIPPPMPDATRRAVQKLTSPVCTTDFPPSPPLVVQPHDQPNLDATLYYLRETARCFAARA